VEHIHLSQDKFGPVAGCCNDFSRLVPQKVTDFVTNVTSVRFSRTAQNGIGYSFNFVARYSALQAKIQVCLDVSPFRSTRRY